MTSIRHCPIFLNRQCARATGYLKPSVPTAVIQGREIPAPGEGNAEHVHDSL